MDELLALRTHIEQGRYAEALALIGEMEEMSRVKDVMTNLNLPPRLMKIR